MAESAESGPGKATPCCLRVMDLDPLLRRLKEAFCQWRQAHTQVETHRDPSGFELDPVRPAFRRPVYRDP